MSCGCGNNSSVKTIGYKGDNNCNSSSLYWGNILGIPECITDCDTLLNFIENNFTTVIAETDPTVPQYVKDITSTEISNWNTSFSWGNHSGLYVPITRSVNTGSGLTGGGILSSDLTIEHDDTSSVIDVDFSSAQVVDEVIFDEFGHVISFTSRNLTPADIGAQPAGSIPGTPDLQAVTTVGASTSVLSTFSGGLSVSNTFSVSDAGTITKSGTGLKIASNGELQFTVPSSTNISFYRNALLTNVIYSDGRMAGANAINPDEFVTKGQLDAFVIEPGDNIINQFSSSQLNASFWIDGNARIGSSLYIGQLDLYEFNSTDVILGSYPSSRDDSTVTSISNILYTNTDGNLLSAPISELPFVLATRQILAGDGLIGGGDLSSDVTLSHADTSSVSNIDTTGAQVVDVMEFDTYGHVTSISLRGLTTGDISAVPTAREITLANGPGITIPSNTQTLAANRTWTISHGDTSSLDGQLITPGEVLESVTVDTFGHITAFTTVDASVTTPDLQAVTSAGNVTTDSITVNGIVSNSNVDVTGEVKADSAEISGNIVVSGGGSFVNPVSGADAVLAGQFVTLQQLNASLVNVQTGPWTPVLRGYRGPTTGDPSTSLHTISGYTVDNALYYKFGSMVYLLVNISWTAAGVTVDDGGSLLEIGGLPYEITTAGTSSYLSNRGIVKLDTLVDDFFEEVLVQHSDPSYGQVIELWNSDASYMTCSYLTGVGAGNWQFSIMVNYMTNEA